MGLAARLLLALGAACLLLGIYLMSKTLDFTEGAERAVGEVVRYHEIPDGGSTRYVPMVRFTTPSGDIVTVAGQLTTTSKRFAVGDQVPVTYPPGQPMKARLATFTDNWLPVTIAGVVGALALIAGVFIRRAVRRDLARAGA
jgi:hypothetical protein